MSDGNISVPVSKISITILILSIISLWIPFLGLFTLISGFLLLKKKSLKKRDKVFAWIGVVMGIYFVLFIFSIYLVWLRGQYS